MLQQLLPEMVGLAVTPAAIIATLLLLDSSRPVRNVAVFAAGFLVLYVVISVAVVGGASAAGASGSGSHSKSWASLVVGLLFLAGGAVALVRGRGRRAERGAEPPAWAERLSDPSTRTVVVAGVALSAINPNLAILASGLTAVVTAEVGGGDRVVGVLLLLGSCLLDFVVPLLVYLLLGERARSALSAAKGWLIRHNRVIGVVVLLAFGVLFTVRGAAALLG